MAIKPFEIQGTSLSIGGVEIQSSQDGKVVLPGVSQATEYKLVGFETFDDQGTTFQGLSASDVAVWIYDDFLNLTDDGIIQNPPPSDYGYAWIIDDDELKLTVIEGSLRTFTLAQVTASTNNNVRITTVFSDSPANTQPSVDAQDYISVPIRPVFEAVSVEIIGGGGVDGLSGNTSFTPEAEGDPIYSLNINSNIALTTYQTGESPGNFGPGVSLGQGISDPHRSGVVAIGNDDVGFNSKPGGVYNG